MPLAATLAFAVLALAPALGQTRLSPAEFEAIAQGRTLHFSLDGAAFGSEQFFADRRSLWRFSDDWCEPGRWHAEGEAICFVYESMGAPICWHFLHADGGYSAALVEGGAETGFQLDLDRIDGTELPCPGPRVGS